MANQEEEVTSICDGCGASVYQEHLDSGIARHEDGKLLCAPCVTEFEEKAEASGSAAVEAIEPIELDTPPADLSSSGTMSSSRIHGMSEATLGHKENAWDSSHFKRKLDPTSPFAIRCRTFHCKLSEGAIEFLNTQVNEWLDANPDIFIKIARTNIGPFEGKHTEPNLIVTLLF